ncbi:ABC transporter permease, partial [Enterovibrio norvegicus FF-162]|uniref:ABC transporter permease n=1 Tax=Enterovibrio norvegicus TaxID=188144 RepID=UPI0005536F1B
MADNSWLTEFPEMERSDLLTIRKTLDGAYREFSRNYGETIESFFDPLLQFLIWFEKLLLGTPWWLMIVILAGVSYLASRSWKLGVSVIFVFLAIGYFGMWEDTMRTMSIILVCTMLAIGLGIPIGIAMARSNRIQSLVTPLLDVMQTMPAFVYLIPVVMLLGIGKIPGVIAVIIYAIPPVIRLTNLGIRLVDKEVLEAATAYGASPT